MRKEIFGLILLVIIVSLTACTSKYESHYNLGKWYYDKGLIDEAILEFKNATKADMDNYQAHHSLAVAYTKKGWFKYALKEAEVAFDLYPADKNYDLIQLIKQKFELEKKKNKSE